MGQLEQIPDKPQYKSSEVCQYTDTQPYVLRFWESEFPQLAPERRGSGPSVYTRRDIDVVLRIKRLLHDEEHTLADARRCLQDELDELDELDERDERDERGQEIDEGRAAARKEPTRDSGATGRAPTAPAAPGLPDSAAATPAARFDSPEREQRAYREVPRERYEDAIDEIAHLRLRLKEAETQIRRSENGVREAEQRAQRHRERCDLAVARLKQLLELVS